MVILTNRIFQFIAISVFFIAFTRCSNEKKHQASNNNIYILDFNQISFDCDYTRSDDFEDSILSVPTSSCYIIIENFSNHPHRELIKNTDKNKWIELINSESKEIAKSSCLWLYFLMEEKISIADYKLIELWNSNIRKEQIKFWESYLR